MAMPRATCYIRHCLCCFPSGARAAERAQAQSEELMKNFDAINSAHWQEVFSDSCTGNWKDFWTLDGLKATVTNSVAGMDFSAGAEWGNDESHAVIWTRRSFSGDIRVAFEYTRLDHAARGVNILYLLATGSGTEPYQKDIAAWSDLRQVSAMKTYFNHMNLYHISFAAYGNTNGDPASDYIRARRYLPETNRGLDGTDLPPDNFSTGFFQPGVPHAITVIRKGGELFMLVRAEGREMLYRWKTDAFPPIEEGRIGIRHMSTRSARYRHVRISVLTD